MESPHIFTIRGQRVMLDFQLAQLYGMETRVLNQAVKRNIERFDSDFMFQLKINEIDEARSQFVISLGPSNLNQVGGWLPFAFTELGIAMLSSVLRTREAIEVNKGIMRTFFKMRSYLVLGNSHGDRLDKLEQESIEIRQTFGEVFERLDNVERDTIIRAPVRKKKIGLK